MKKKWELEKCSQLKKELEAVGVTLQLQKSRARTTAYYKERTLHSYIKQMRQMSPQDLAVALTSQDPIYRIIQEKIL